MRWFWIDRFTEFISGRSATAIKNVSLGEEQIQEHYPGFPVMPASLIIEGLAQTGGLLVGQPGEFRQKVVLAKIARAQFTDLAVPGDTLTYQVEATSLRGSGSVVQGSCRAGDRPVAEVELMFAHLDERFAGVELFEPAMLIRMLRTVRLFEVARDAQGRRLKVPEYLCRAEAESSGPALTEDATPPDPGSA